jgi:hypothetical protein
MSKKQDGGPAFPAEHGLSKSGMSLRDWFAGQALVGLAREISDDITVHRRNGIASDAYELADAMLAERSKP